MFVTPLQCLPVQICKIAENPVGQEVVLYKANQPFHFALGKRMPWFTELCLKVKDLHKGLVVFLPNWMPLQIPVKHYTLHIVS